MTRLITATAALLLCACPEEEPTDSGAADTGDTGAPEEECVEVDFTDGSSGTYTIDSASDDHVKHHFDMPEGTTRLEATATWSETEWEMALDVGTGMCPHSGTSHVQVAGAGGELTAEVQASDLGLEAFAPDETWFLHLGEDMPVDPDDGSTSDYAVSALACRPL